MLIINPINDFVIFLENGNEDDIFVIEVFIDIYDISFDINEYKNLRKSLLKRHGLEGDFNILPYKI